MATMPKKSDPRTIIVHLPSGVSHEIDQVVQVSHGEAGEVILFVHEHDAERPDYPRMRKLCGFPPGTVWYDKAACEGRIKTSVPRRPEPSRIQPVGLVKP